MSDQELTHEQLRELAKRVRGQLPDGLLYCLLVWPPDKADDVGYFSNAHRSQAVIALESLLGALGEGQ